MNSNCKFSCHIPFVALEILQATKTLLQANLELSPLVVKEFPKFSNKFLQTSESGI